MELGLSLGFLDKNIQNQNQKKMINNGGLDFCIALGLNSIAVGNDRETDRRKTQKSHENDDEDGGDGGGGGGGGGGCEISDDGDGSDDNTLGEAHLQLNLAPVVPRRRLSSSHIQSFPWSSDNVFGPSEGSSENGGSSGNIGAAAAWGLDVNRLPEAAASAAEDVSSENTAGSPFNLGFGVYRNTENPPSGAAAGKRDFDAAAAANDGSAGSSRASDDDENGVNARKKLRLSKEQSAYLEESFKEHNTLNPKQKQALAKQLNLRPRQVEVWFQNRRARTKLKQTEVDCEYLKRCCETLTVENRRLHKEVQELRALKTTSNNPFYTQLPATTLTMCPSCERVATTTAAANNNNNSITKAIGFPVSRPRFYPFSQTPTHNHNSKSSV